MNARFAKQHRRQLRMFYERITADAATHWQYVSCPSNRLLSRYSAIGLLGEALKSAMYFFYTTQLPRHRQSMIWASQFYRSFIRPQEAAIITEFSKPCLPFVVEELEFWLRV